MNRKRNTHAHTLVLLLRLSSNKRSSKLSSSAAKTFRTTFVSALSLVVVDLISGGHCFLSENHSGPSHQSLLSFISRPLRPRSAGLSWVATWRQWIDSGSCEPDLLQIACNHPHLLSSGGRRCYPINHEILSLGIHPKLLACYSLDLPPYRLTQAEAVLSSISVWLT